MGKQVTSRVGAGCGEGRRDARVEATAGRIGASAKRDEVLMGWTASDAHGERRCDRLCGPVPATRQRWRGLPRKDSPTSGGIEGGDKVRVTP